MAKVDEPFRIKLDHFFGQLLQSGLLEKYHNWAKFMTVTNNRFIPQDITENHDMITFDSIYLVMIFYVILNFSSIFLFVGEILYNKYVIIIVKT